MTNKTRSLDDIPVAYMMDDSWVWKDDMIVFPRDDGFYDDETDDGDDCWFDLSFAEDGLIDGEMGDVFDYDNRSVVVSYMDNATQNELDFNDHPICGEFPHDSIVAPRGWDKVD